MHDQTREHLADGCCEVPAELPDPPEPARDVDVGDVRGLPV